MWGLSSVRARVRLGVVAMVLPLLVLSATAVTALEGTLDRFADTADEAIEEALPLARLQALVSQVERSGLRAVMAPGPTTAADYRAARTRMEQAFADLGDGELTEEGELVVRAWHSAEQAAVLLDKAQDAVAAGSSATLFAVIDGHTDAALRALAEAEQLAEADIVSEYEDAQQVERRAVGWIVGVVLVGLVLAAAAGLRLIRAVIPPLDVLRQGRSPARRRGAVPPGGPAAPGRVRGGGRGV